MFGAVFCASFVIGAATTTAVTFADSYSSNMVLQQLPSPSVLWGFAPAGTRLTVSRTVGSHGTQGATAADVVTGSDGVWRADLPGLPAGNETFNFSVVAAHSTVSLQNVVYGDGANTPFPTLISVRVGVRVWAGVRVYVGFI